MNSSTSVRKATAVSIRLLAPRISGRAGLRSIRAATYGVLVWLALGLTSAPADGQSLRQALDADGPSRLGGDSIFGGQERLPTPDDDGQLRLPPLVVATTRTDKIGNGSLPAGYAKGFADRSAALPEQIEQRGDDWDWAMYSFAPSNTFSHPLYFEDVMLERHGHERFPMLQPMISGGRFLATVPMLPYLMTVTPPWEIQYKLGHFPAGDPVYPYLQRPPYVRRAAAVQAATITAAVFALP